MHSAAGSTPSTSTSLIQRAMDNEPDAWQRLADIHGPVIYRWCREAGLQRADARDVAQEVFRAVLGNLAAFRRDRPGDTFTGWLRTITGNKIRDHYRRARRNPPAGGGSAMLNWLNQTPDDQPESIASDARFLDENALASRLLEVVRASVTDTTWQAFWGVVVDDRPAKDMAEELDMTLGAVYKAVRRVRERFRQERADLE